MSEQPSRDNFATLKNHLQTSPYHSLLPKQHRHEVLMRNGYRTARALYNSWCSKRGVRTGCHRKPGAGEAPRYRGGLPPPSLAPQPGAPGSPARHRRARGHIHLALSGSGKVPPAVPSKGLSRSQPHPTAFHLSSTNTPVFLLFFKTVKATQLKETSTLLLRLQPQA